MPTRNISLTEHFDQFVAEQVRAGRYSNASEVLRAGLHLLEKQEREDEEKLRVLRAMVAEGIEAGERGEYTILNGESEISEFIAKLGREARELVNAKNGELTEADNAASATH